MPVGNGFMCKKHRAQYVEECYRCLQEERDSLASMVHLLQERNTRYLAALTDIGEQDENALVYLPTAHLKGQRARKAIH